MMYLLRYACPAGVADIQLDVRVLHCGVVVEPRPDCCIMASRAHVIASARTLCPWDPL